jgi:hypothetical protein
MGKPQFLVSSESLDDKTTDFRLRSRLILYVRITK